MYNLSDTIAAICTPPGIGAIAAIRISGPESWAIAKKIFVVGSSGRFKTYHYHHMQAVYGYIVDGDKVIDEVITLPYKSPNSFTTEDVIEIFCHGGSKIASMILDLCLKNGARKASKGEFTFRAFVNGRIDLTEAEAVNEIINADNLYSIYNASSNLTGSLKEKLSIFREKIFNLLTSIESHLEFPLDVPQTERSQIIEELSSIKNELEDLICGSNQGQMLRTGIKVSILGIPNVGKSSLLNQLLESERAIVTDEPGTTRDTVEEKAVIGDLPFVLVDTAGIRDNMMEVSKAEKLGIQRSRNSIDASDIVLIMFDLTKGICDGTRQILGSINGKPKILIGNKIDLFNGNENALTKFDVSISAKYGTNLNLLKNLLVEKASNLLKNDNGNNHLYNFSINQRQKELLLQCSQSIENAINAASYGTEDLIASELKNSISRLDEISGRKVNEEIITNIFAKFCIGK